MCGKHKGRVLHARVCWFAILICLWLDPISLIFSYMYFIFKIMLDVLLVWIKLAGQKWVYYRLNPGLPVPFFLAVTRVLEQWASTVVCVFCGNSLSYSAHSTLQKVQMQIEVEKSLVCQLISVNLRDQSTFFMDTLAQFFGVKWSTSKCTENQRSRQSRGCGAVKVNYESNDKSDSSKYCIGLCGVDGPLPSSVFRPFLSAFARWICLIKPVDLRNIILFIIHQNLSA